MNLLADPAAVLHFTNDDNLSTAPTPRWKPDDEGDFIEQLRNSLRDETIACIAKADSGGCPDIEVRAGVAVLHDVPWPAPPAPEHYVVFVDNSETGFTIVEFPSRQAAATAFADHVNSAHADNASYDYVVDPKRPQTAFPPGWPSVTWPDSTTVDAHPPNTELLDETTADTDLVYGLTRIYRLNAARIRVTVRRHVLHEKSRATAEERAPDGSWHHLIDTPNGDWIPFTPHPAESDPEPKYTAVSDVADDLLKRSRRILSW